MKLIIDIPDDEYRHIKEYYEKNDIVEATYSYIYHGIPLDDVLDKIRAEIKKAMEDFYYDEHDLGVRAGFRFALEIIGNYEKGGE